MSSSYMDYYHERKYYENRLKSLEIQLDFIVSTYEGPISNLPSIESAGFESDGIVESVRELKEYVSLRIDELKTTIQDLKLEIERLLVLSPPEIEVSLDLTDYILTPYNRSMQIIAIGNRSQGFLSTTIRVSEIYPAETGIPRNDLSLETEGHIDNLTLELNVTCQEFCSPKSVMESGVLEEYLNKIYKSLIVVKPSKFIVTDGYVNEVDTPVGFVEPERLIGTPDYYYPSVGNQFEKSFGEAVRKASISHIKTN